MAIVNLFEDLGINLLYSCEYMILGFSIVFLIGTISTLDLHIPARFTEIENMSYSAIIFLLQKIFVHSIAVFIGMSYFIKLYIYIYSKLQYLLSIKLREMVYKVEKYE